MGVGACDNSPRMLDGSNGAHPIKALVSKPPNPVTSNHKMISWLLFNCNFVVVMITNN